MKKGILFVIHNIGIGGSMTSMLNLLELLQQQGFEIDLFIMEHSGAFLNRAIKAANLLNEDIILSSVICDKNKLIKERNLAKLFIRFTFVAAHKLIGVEKTYAFIYRWRANKLSGKYGNVIAFQEGMTTDFVQYINAQNKIAWIHNDYERFSVNYQTEIMQERYDHFDKIVSVSQASRNSMLSNLNNLEDKVYIIYNTLNSSYITEKSQKFIYDVDKSLYNFVSIGRFVEQKRFDRIIRASQKLVKSGFKFKWYIIGNGDLFNDINQMIKDESLEDVIILLGAQTNPYPYIKSADYLVISSLYEAQPMVANEGLILDKPVISTAFSSVYEVIDDKKNGIICQNSTDGLYVGIRELLENKDLRKTIKLGAKSFTYNNETILTQISELLI